VRSSARGPRGIALCGVGSLLVLAASVLVRVPFYEAFLSAGF
jgi:hypothetical protein